MSESMVERVARAIEQADWHDPKVLARAAIEAMREIPGKIGDAGYDAFEAWERGESTAILPHGPIWRAMIDAALAEPHHMTARQDGREPPHKARGEIA